MNSLSGIVSLREVTAETVGSISRLRVTPAQEGFVANNSFSIAQAYFDPKAWFRAIYADETPVGFVMLSIDTEIPAYYIWRFMIDAKHQRHGYGAKAMDLVIKHIRSLPNAKEAILSYVPGEGSPVPFYQRAGFVPTGAIDQGEIVMRLVL
jgi:diamine N-acetyltransferase